MSDLLMINLNNENLNDKEVQVHLERYKNKIVHSFFAEDNEITKVEKYDIYTEHIIQVSFSHNQLASINLIDQFSNLKILNLSSNFITQIDEICKLPQLEWLNIKDNPLRNINVINSCKKLVYLDASSNQLTKLPLLSTLLDLKTVLLNRNFIQSLSDSSTNLPPNIQHFSIEFNQINDAYDVKHLKELRQLERLSLANNYCCKHDVIMSSSPTEVTSSYREFVMGELPNLKILDEISIGGQFDHRREGDETLESSLLCGNTTTTEGGNTTAEENDESSSTIDANFKLSPKSLSFSQTDEDNHKEDGEHSTVTNQPTVSSTPHCKGRVEGDKMEMLSPVRSSSPELPHLKQRSGKKEKVDQKNTANEDEKATTNKQNGSTTNKHNDTTIEEAKLLLLSESEFIPGDDIPDDFFNQRHHYDDDVIRGSGDKTLFRFDEDLSTYGGGGSVTTWNNHSTTPSSVCGFSKYEEYEMRPIKPLNSKLQVEMYGEVTTSNGGGSQSKPRPQPLKKFSGPTSKHDVSRTSRHNETRSKKQHLTPSRRKSAQPLFGNTRKNSKSEKERKQENQRKIKSPVLYPSGKPLDNLFHKYPQRNAKLHRCATKIQAAWRGYQVRHTNPKVKNIKYELRARRSEYFISILCEEMKSMKSIIFNERNLRKLQIDALKHLWQQVNEMKNGEQQNIEEGENSKCDDSEEEKSESKYESENQENSDGKKNNNQNLENKQSTRKKHEPKVESHHHNDVAMETSGKETSPKTSEENEELKKENLNLRKMMDVLQAQVIQLQETVLKIQDQITDKPTETTAATLNSTYDVEDEEADDANRGDDVIIKSQTSPSKDRSLIRTTRLSLREILDILDRSFNKDEIWSVCHQCCITFLTHRVSLVSLETVFVEESGKISFTQENNKDVPIEKSISALSFTLWCLSENRKFSPEFEQLLIEMEENRVSIEQIIQNCERSMGADKSTKILTCLLQLATNKLRHNMSGSNVSTHKSSTAPPKSPENSSSKIPERKSVQGTPDFIKNLKLFKKSKSAVPQRNPEPRKISPPQMLKVEVMNNSNDEDEKTFKLILRWINTTQELLDNEKLVGYRIFVNNQAKGMISSTKSRALLEGMKISCQYQIHITTVTSLAESAPSNCVTVINNPQLLDEKCEEYSIERSIEANNDDVISPPTSSNFTASSKTEPMMMQKSSNYDVIIERVLSRYGIPKSQHMTNNATTSSLASVTSSFKSDDVTLPDPTMTSSPTNNKHHQFDDVIRSSTTSQSSSDSSVITPRSKLLLEQLKDELLQRAT